MSFLNKLNKAKGGYIFLSHSHDDIEKVRIIRNSLEDNGFEPLCFYLKCLSDDSEIEDLIKREIDAREWFVFANSENARKSKWVNLEREYITRTDSKKIITINLEDDRSISEIIYEIVHNLRVFISYSASDHIVARRIKNKFEEKDYLTFFAPDSIPIGQNYADTIENAIVEASQEGCVIALLSSRAVESMWVMNEIVIALANNGNVIPVLLGNVTLSRKLGFFLADRQFYQLSENPTDDELDLMVERISRRFSNKHKKH